MEECFYEKFEERAPKGAVDCIVTDSSGSVGSLKVQAVRSGITYVVENPPRAFGSGEMVAVMPSEFQTVVLEARGSFTAFTATLIDLDL